MINFPADIKVWFLRKRNEEWKVFKKTTRKTW